MSNQSPAAPSRRTFLAGSALAAGAMLGQSTAPSVLRAAVPSPKDDGTVRDKLWLWTHPAGSHNYIKLADGSPAWSRMTPVEGALYMGLHNIYFVHYAGKPELEHYDFYARSFEPMKRVVWSITGMGGESSAQLRERTLELAKKHPNVTGFILDDFLHYNNTVNRHWLAENDVAFPVVLTLRSKEPVTLDRVRLVQSEWHTRDYRTAKIELEVTADGERWETVKATTLPRETGAVVDIALPARTIHKIAQVRVRILSTHDDMEHHSNSCGLRAVRLYNGDEEISLAEWTADATSEHSSAYGAANLVSGPKDAGAEDPVPASMTPQQLAAMRPKLDLGDGRKLPLISVVYTHQISTRIQAHIRHVDQVAMWTWKSAGLTDLESNFETMSRAVKKPMILGCYMYDYGFNGDDQPMPVERMKYQCELGLKWLKEGRIEGMIFLASNVCDMNFEAVEWTRQWIAKVGDQRL